MAGVRPCLPLPTVAVGGREFQTQEAEFSTTATTLFPTIDQQEERRRQTRGSHDHSATGSDISFYAGTSPIPGGAMQKYVSRATCPGAGKLPRASCGRYRRSHEVLR